MDGVKFDMVRTMSEMNDIITKMSGVIDILFSRLSQYVAVEELEGIAGRISEIAEKEKRLGV